MKKVLLLLIIFTVATALNLSWAQLGVGQQMQNNNFESWYNETSSRTAPTGWRSLNSGTGSLNSVAAADFVSSSTSSYNASAGKCVVLTARSVYGVTGNGSLTSGCFNAGSTTASNSKNCTYTSTNSGYNQALNTYPDSVYVWVKTTLQSSSHEARFNIVIHNNTVSSGASNNAVYQDPTPTAGSGIFGGSEASNSVVNTTSAVNESKAVAKATLNFNTGGDWVQKKVAFTYTYNGSTPSYILATFSTNKTAGQGSAGNDKLYFDDVVLIYNTRLATLSINNTPLNNFNADITSYDYPSPIATCAGASFPTVTGTCQSAHASTQIIHNPTELEPYTIIRVKHQNQESTVYKDYRINFTVITAPNAPTVSVPDPECAAEAHPVVLTASSDNATGYRWYTSANATNPVGTSASYTTPSISGSATYYVSALNSYNCESSRTSATVSINITPSVPSAGSTTPICAGNTGTFTATLPDGDNLVCRWYESNSSTAVLGTGTSLQVQNLTQTTTCYASTYNTATGCESGRTAVTVNVNNAPEVTISPVSPICAGESATLTASGATSYTWDHNLGEGNNKQVSPNTTTIYTVTGSDAIGCSSTTSVTVTVNQLPNVSIDPVNPICAGQSTTLTATGATNYSWDNNLGTGNNKVVSPTTQTTYTVTGTEDGCSSTASITVEVNQLPNVSINSVNPICAGESTTLTATGATSYSWDNNLGTGNDKQVSPSSTTTYNVTGTDGNGCSNTASVTVTVNTLPNVGINPVDPICAGQSVTLTATGATSYTWDNNLGEGNDKQVSPNTTTIYNVNGTDANGCSNTASVTVTVNPIPAVPVCQNDTLCGSGQAVLTAIPAENCSCQWFNEYNIDITAGTDNNTTTYTTSTLNQSTVYHVRSVNTTTHCYSETVDIQVIVNALPGNPTVSNNAPAATPTPAAGTLPTTPSCTKEPPIQPRYWKKPQLLIANHTTLILVAKAATLVPQPPPLIPYL